MNSLEPKHTQQRRTPEQTLAHLQQKLAATEAAIVDKHRRELTRAKIVLGAAALAVEDHALIETLLCRLAPRDRELTLRVVERVSAK